MAVSEVPQVTVRAQPTVKTAAPPPPPDSAKHTTPLEVPATVAINSTIKEANPLSLGGLPQLLAGIDGIIGPPPPPVLAAEARKVAVGAGAGAEAAAADASVAWLDARREEHTERADSTEPWEAQHDITGPQLAAPLAAQLATAPAATATHRRGPTRVLRAAQEESLPRSGCRGAPGRQLHRRWPPRRQATTACSPRLPSSSSMSSTRWTLPRRACVTRHDA